MTPARWPVVLWSDLTLDRQRELAPDAMVSWTRLAQPEPKRKPTPKRDEEGKAA
jgi:hypothetical protein